MSEALTSDVGMQNESLTLSAQIAQTFAVYSTHKFAVPLHSCVGAVKQPLGATPLDARRSRNAIQHKVLKACKQSARGGDTTVPALFFQEALHGAEGDTIFPSPAALGASWDPQLFERVMAVVAASARALGSHAVLAPVLDLFVDGRFGRMQEGFGEDPMHVAAFARAAAIGLQGPRNEGATRARSASSNGDDKRSGDGRQLGSGRSGKRAPGSGLLRLRPGKVYAIAKHFLGYGAIAGGLNGASFTGDERSLLEDHLRPWRAFVSAGGAGAMVGHHAALGVPCHANAALMRGVLRAKLGLPGPIFSDCNDIGGLVPFRVAANRTAAAAMAMSAGVDVDLQCGRHCPSMDSDDSSSSSSDDGESGQCGAFFNLRRAIDSGQLHVSVLRSAVARLLSLKSAAGLLRAPLGEPWTRTGRAAAAAAAEVPCSSLRRRASARRQ